MVGGGLPCRQRVGEEEEGGGAFPDRGDQAGGKAVKKKKSLLLIVSCAREDLRGLPADIWTSPQ